MATNTAASFTNHTGNASAGPFSISFSYLDEDEVDVTVDGVLKTKTTHYTFPSATTISFTSGNHPASGAAIKFQRDTDVSAKKVDFQDGSVLTETDLDNNSDQILYGLQENLDVINNDILKRDGSQTVTGNLVFEGSTDDGNETTLAITDPTADRTITVPDITGTIVTTGDTGTVTSTMINNGTIVDADINSSAAISQSKIATGTLPSGIQVNSDNIVNGSIVTGDIATGTLDGRYYTETELDAGQLDNRYYTETELDAGQLDNRYYTETELNAGQLDNRYYTETEADARFYNLASTEEIQSGETWVAADNKVATTSAIDNRIVDLVDDVGGFVPLVSEATFPAANPDVNNGAGTIVSVGVLGTSYTPSSGTVTIPDSTLTNISGSNVTITDCGSTVLASGHGVLVETTSTLHTYKFHRLTPKATEVTTVAGNTTNINTVAGNNTNINTVAGISSNVTTVAGISSNVTSVAGNSSNINSAVSNASNINSAVSNATNINTVAGAITNVNNVGGSIANVNTVAGNLSGVNDFGERYRAATNNSGEYSSNNDVGDLYFNTDINALKVWNGSAWVAGVTDSGDYAVTTGDTFTGNLKLSDSVELRIGNGDDLKIYHDGSNHHSYIDNTHPSGHLYIRNTGTANNVYIQARSGEDSILCHDDGAVELFYNGVEKFQTHSDGIRVDGTQAEIRAEGASDEPQLKITSENTGIWLRAAGSSGSFPTGGGGDDAELLCLGGNFRFGIGTASKDLIFINGSGYTERARINSSGSFKLPDSAKIELGGAQTGSGDLQIYHDGSHSTILNSTGTLYTAATQQHFYNTAFDELQAKFIENGAVELYYDNSKKLETMGSGITVSGYVNISGTSGWALQCTNNNKLGIGTNQHLQLYADGTDSFISESGSGNLKILTSALAVRNAANSELLIYATENGQVSLYYDHSKKLETTSSGVTVTGSLTETSDIALKHNINTIQNPLDLIEQIRGINFTWKTNGMKSMGVIAQDVEKVFPELVHGNEGSKSLQYSGLIGALVESVKELSAKIAALESA